MKKIFTLLFATALVMSAFAQFLPNQDRHNRVSHFNPQNTRPIERREPAHATPPRSPEFGNINRMPVFHAPTADNRDNHRPRDNDRDRNRHDRDSWRDYRDHDRDRDRDRDDWYRHRRDCGLSVHLPLNLTLIFPVEVTQTYSESWDFYTPYGEFHDGYYYERMMLEDRVFFLDNYRPMFGYTQDWVRDHRCESAPRYSRPRWDCYRGYFWYTQPDSFYLVWVWNDRYQNYYPAYYYPEYGYYAWTSEPLIAVGEYRPQFSIVINLR